MRRTFTMIAATAAGLFLASAAWAQQVIPGAQPVPPAVQPLPPGTQVLPPGTQVLPPGAQVLPPGAQPVQPGVQTIPPGAEPVQPGVQPGRVARQAGRGPVNDRLFAMAAAAGGLAELTTSNLALQRTENPEIRQLAQRMIADHTRANQELLSLAGARGIGVPATLDIKDQAAADVLNGLRRDEFDRAYIRGQVASHMCAVALFEAESQRGGDPELRAFAAKTLPTLREHLQHAREHLGQGGRAAEARGDDQRHDDTERPEGAVRPEGARRPANADRANDNDRTRDENRPAGARRPENADRTNDNDRTRDENRPRNEDRTKEEARPRNADPARDTDTPT
jgi:putative membrane protein